MLSNKYICQAENCQESIKSAADLLKHTKLNHQPTKIVTLQEKIIRYFNDTNLCKLKNHKSFDDIVTDAKSFLTKLKDQVLLFEENYLKIITNAYDAIYPRSWLVQTTEQILEAQTIDENELKRYLTFFQIGFELSKDQIDQCEQLHNSIIGFCTYQVNFTENLKRSLQPPRKPAEMVSSQPKHVQAGRLDRAFPENQKPVSATAQQWNQSEAQSKQNSEVPDFECAQPQKQSQVIQSEKACQIESKKSLYPGLYIDHFQQEPSESQIEQAIQVLKGIQSKECPQKVARSPFLNMDDHLQNEDWGKINFKSREEEEGNFQFQVSQRDQGVKFDYIGHRKNKKPKSKAKAVQSKSNVEIHPLLSDQIEVAGLKYISQGNRSCRLVFQSASESVRNRKLCCHIKMLQEDFEFMIGTINLNDYNLETYRGLCMINEKGQGFKDGQLICAKQQSVHWHDSFVTVQVNRANEVLVTLKSKGAFRIDAMPDSLEDFKSLHFVVIMRNASIEVQ